jgi:hypothetical protein
MTLERVIDRDQIHTNGLDALSLLPKLDLAKSSQEVSQALRTGFIWLHLAEKRVPVGTIHRWLQENAHLVNPPRTAHIGGVQEAIMAGGGGSVAFNRLVYETGTGHPLLFDMNQTPGNDGQGDTLYYPGTILDKDGSIQKLDILVSRGGKFVPANGETIFTPFAATRVNGELVGVNHVHRERIHLPNVNYISDVLLDRWSDYEIILKGIFSHVLLFDGPGDRQKALTAAFNRWVNPNGSIRKAKSMRADNEGVTYQGRAYTWDEFLALHKKMLTIAAQPWELKHLIKELPDGAPLASNQMLIAALALLDTDFTEGTKCQGKVNPHFHWGGFLMAGMGEDSGYFKGSANAVGRITKSVNIGLRDNGHSGELFMPIAYVLMPAAIYLLVPHAAQRAEVAAVNDLLQQVQAEPQTSKPQKKKTIRHIRQLMKSWLAQHHEHLSRAFLSRFANNVHPMSIIPEDSTLIIPDAFFELTFQQLALTAGFLKEEINKK